VGYEYLDISGDAGLRLSGGTLEEVFKDAAVGMYSLITDIDEVREESEIRVEAESHSPEGLLVSWLNELIFQFDTYGFVGRRVAIEELGDRRIAARIAGEEFDPARHERRLLLKAATYHNLRLERMDGGWQVEVIFDI
jgi:SHS2 domain-containing protein